jgi:hypothetical protein
MEQRNIALAILGIVAVLAIVGLVLLFTSRMSGAGVYGGYVSNPVLRGDTDPYSRIKSGRATYEEPGWMSTVNIPEQTTYGGGIQVPVGEVRAGEEKTVQQNTRYKRSAETAIPTKGTTTSFSCRYLAQVGMFKDEAGRNVFAPEEVGVRMWQSISGKQQCFTHTYQGEPLSTYRVGAYACCTSAGMKLT